LYAWTQWTHKSHAEEADRAVKRGLGARSCDLAPSQHKYGGAADAEGTVPARNGWGGFRLPDTRQGRQETQYQVPSAKVLRDRNRTPDD
jgi:hypothetical protein